MLAPAAAKEAVMGDVADETAGKISCSRRPLVVYNEAEGP